MDWQAHQLAEEEDEDDDDEDESVNETRQQEQQQLVSSQISQPARGIKKTVNRYDRPLKSDVSKADNETGKADHIETQSSSHNARAPSAGPTASRILALKAKLEADKARKAGRSAFSVPLTIC